MDTSNLPLFETNLMEGSLPCVITAPHGGALDKELAKYMTIRENRRKHRLFTMIKDSFTAELTRRIVRLCKAWTGREPYYVIANFKRKYIDANRDLDGEACT